MIKVCQFQNEFMKSSFLPKYEEKIAKISALTTQGRNPDNFWILIHFEINWPFRDPFMLSFFLGT